MKVLEILGSLHRGGAETTVVEYFKAFDKSVCQIDFVIHKEFENDYRQDVIDGGANVFLLSRPGKVGAIRYINMLADVMKKNGPYDAVHIHTNYQAFMGVLAAKKAGIKTIAVHSHTTSFKKHRLLVNRLVFALCGVVRVACGEKAGNAFFGKNKYVVISNAMDVSKFMAVQSDENKEKKNKTVIGHLGRFVTPKNHEFIIELAKVLKQRNLDVCFKLYGEGELKEKIVSLAGENDLCDYVTFMGLTNDTVSAYKSFDMFILPSLYEGVPLTAVEAQLSGLSCLISDTVTKECDLEQGLVTFLPLDVNVWADKIEKLVDGGDLAHKKVVVNDRVASYDVNVQWKKLLSIYKGDLK